jgi:hypothetical protein
MRKFIFLCFELSAESLVFTGTVSRRRQLLKQIEDQKPPPGPYKVKPPQQDLRCALYQSRQHAPARSLPPASLRVCCSINASPAHAEAAHEHHLIIRACACHNATRMGASLVSSHLLHMQPALSLPPARIARLLTCLPHSGTFSLPPSTHSHCRDMPSSLGPGPRAGRE